MSSVNNRNFFRLILGSLRVSLKLIEDKNYKQRYYCKVVGMQNMSEMLNLELAEMFMLNFHLFINEYVLTRPQCPLAFCIGRITLYRASNKKWTPFVKQHYKVVRYMCTANPFPSISHIKPLFYVLM